VLDTLSGQCRRHRQFDHNFFTLPLPLIYAYCTHYILYNLQVYFADKKTVVLLLNTNHKKKIYIYIMEKDKEKKHKHTTHAHCALPHCIECETETRAPLNQTFFLSLIYNIPLRHPFNVIFKTLIYPK
jgi:hypothetical protein